jgi:PatG C-terminal
METQTTERTAVQSSDVMPSISTAATAQPLASVAPQGVSAADACPTCASATAGARVIPPTCVYVIGHIEPRFPLLSVEKEARQATARAGGSTGTDRETMAKVLRDPNNKYLVRQLCWVLSVLGVETYILVPRDGDYQPLIDAYRAEPNPGDVELVIGVRGPIANPEICNGLLVPILIFDQIYAFDRKSLLDSISKPKDADPAKFTAAAGEMFDRIIQQSDNAGATDADRSLNYLAVRYDRIYSLAAEQFANNASFTSIEVLPSPLSGTRRIVDVVFSFTDRATDVVSKYFTRVDVTECWPFLVTKMAAYYDR